MECEYRGFKGTLTDLCRFLDKNPMLVRSRLKTMSLEEALHRPSKNGTNTFKHYEAYLEGYRSTGHTNFVRNR